MATNTPKTLKLFEALELRSEYDARLKTLKDCLPEAKRNRDWGLRSLRDDENRRPSPELDVAATRAEVRRLEVKRRKINTAIQQANFGHRVTVDGDSISLSEALEARKAINERIGELHAQVVSAAWQRVIYKEDRDIIEESELSYEECTRQLDDARLAFRELNRKLRTATFEVTVDFRDEAVAPSEE
jgi:hypothetical protein